MKKGAATRRVQREAAVLKFLLNHPGSTAAEVFAATGFSVLTNTRFLVPGRASHSTLKVQKTLWSVNRLKWVHWMRNIPDAGAEIHSGE